MLTTGDLTNLGRIEVSTRTLAESGQQDLADALARLTEAVTASQETLRSEHLQTLDELAKQAALPEKNAQLQVFSRRWLKDYKLASSKALSSRERGQHGGLLC